MVLNRILRIDAKGITKTPDISCGTIDGLSFI